MSSDALKQFQLVRVQRQSSQDGDKGFAVAPSDDSTLEIQKIAEACRIGTIALQALRSETQKSRVDEKEPK